jgi:DNA-directed RNA polymerase subunit K/omega
MELQLVVARRVTLLSMEVRVLVQMELEHGQKQGLALMEVEQ